MSTAVLLVILIGLMECICDVVLKRWANGRAEINAYIIIGVAIYAVIGMVYAISLRHGMLSVVSSMWQGVSLIFTFFIAILYFNERPTNPQIGCIGLVVVGTIGLVMLE